eukprot:SAG11_NODE_16842_length_535_cov_25.263761_1_plen_91_part_10
MANTHRRRRGGASLRLARLCVRRKVGCSLATESKCAAGGAELAPGALRRGRWSRAACLLAGARHGGRGLGGSSLATHNQVRTRQRFWQRGL